MRRPVPLLFLMLALLMTGASSAQEKKKSAELAKPPAEWAADLKDKNLTVRLAALDALGKLGVKSKPHVNDIRAVFRDAAENPLARAAAAAARGAIAPTAKEIVTDLAEALDSPDAGVRTASAEALVRAGSAAKPVAAKLVAALRDGNPNVRVAAAEALARSGIETKAAQEALAAAMKDDNDFARIAGSAAVLRIGAPAAVPLVTELSAALKDMNFYVRKGVSI